MGALPEGWVLERDDVRITEDGLTFDGDSGHAFTAVFPPSESGFAYLELAQIDGSRDELHIEATLAYGAGARGMGGSGDTGTTPTTTGPADALELVSNAQVDSDEDEVWLLPISSTTTTRVEFRLSGSTRDRTYVIRNVDPDPTPEALDLGALMAESRYRFEASGWFSVFVDADAPVHFDADERAGGRCYAYGDMNRGDGRYDTPHGAHPMEGSVDLRPGPNLVLCDLSSGWVELDDVPPDYADGCHYVTWYFSLHQGDRPVVDLDVDDVTGLVDGVDVGVEGSPKLTSNNAPRVHLLLDSSYSITEAGAEEAVRDGAEAFVEAMPAQTWFRLSQFASEEEVPDLIGSAGDSLTTNGREQTLCALADYDAHRIASSDSATKLYDAMGQAAADIDSADFRQRILVTLTDGQDTASLVLGSESDVTDQLRRCRMRPFMVGLGDDVDHASLSALAPGDAFTADSTDDLATAFEDVAEELRALYTLRVISPSPVEDFEDSTIEVDYGGRIARASWTPPDDECAALDFDTD